jgi:hypothetical protein
MSIILLTLSNICLTHYYLYNLLYVL